ADEAAHPAFSRLFLHASYREDTKILIFARRPRSGEMPAFLAVGFAEQELDFEFDTDRERLLSRPDGIASLPEALKAEMKSGTGALPEAAAALRITTELPPHGKKNCTLLLAAANSEDEAAARLIEARRHGYSAFIRSAAGKDSNEMETRLAALILPQILFPVKDYVDKREAVANNRLSQQGLWSLGISGDYPLILFEYRGQRDAERLLPYIKTQRALRLKGIQADLVITYREGGDYSRQQHSVLNDMIKSCGSEYLIGGRGGVHLVNLSIHPEEIYYLLLTTACHTATSGVGKKLPDDHYESAALNSGNPVSNRAESEKNLAVYGGEFLGPDFIISHEQKPSAPWCHVLANRTFGTLLSDRALGFTWALNSRENKLTPWNNDPLADNRGEMLLLKVGNKIFDLCANARVTFSPSKAVYETVIDQLFCRVTVEIPGKMMAKLVRLEIENRAKKEYHLRIAYYVEPIMGVNASTRRHISIQQDQGVVQMRNAWAPVRGAGFLTALEGMDGFLYNRAGILSGNWENAGDDISPDSCAAAVVKRKLPPGKTTVATFVLGWAAEKGAAQAMAGMLKSTDPARSAGDGPLSGDGLKVSTPDPYLDALMDTWLRWQFMSSRIMGKTGFYQNGGAWGFRDQLQDCCAALLFDPQFAKAHLYRSAAHQFKEGDVMHWWHQLPPRDGGTRGVRTRCSDDMLWLPLTLCEYLEKTGDDSIFDHEVYYLDGKELEQKEEDRYFFPQRSEEKENLYFHCVRAIERAKRLGAHEIPLFGGGDWNDGMNLVGIAGKGESVWLAMFLSIVLERFAPLCKKQGDETRGEQYLAESAQLRKAVDETCWDGKWYLRGFYDDGFPLGGKESGECRIDLLPQSFSAIAGFPDKERRQAALDSALKMLKDDRLKIVRLFTPPFDGGGRNPGYICSYPPGIRENGGQYTHAAIWLALGLLKEGRGDDAFQILQYINPAYRSLDQESSRTYRLEPYAIAADIYANQSCEGRGGWSLYTGAAGWYYRTVFEDLLGIQIRADHIGLNPVMPSDWQGFSAEIRLRGSEIHLRVEKGTKKKLTVDGAEAESIPLDGKKHNVLLVL
ncbi:MAG TPA: glycosyl hydrolase family 65 protein, partial [Clostridia bacterium]|nr:glycosyl hydrolase family 65 protein [Clostridia bacterium]